MVLTLKQYGKRSQPKNLLWNITVLTPPYGGGDEGRSACFMSYSFLFKESSHTSHVWKVGPTAT